MVLNCSFLLEVLLLARMFPFYMLLHVCWFIFALGPYYYTAILLSLETNCTKSMVSNLYHAWHLTRVRVIFWICSHTCTLSIAHVFHYSKCLIFQLKDFKLQALLKDTRYADGVSGYQQWLEDIRDGKQPGNHITLQALANLYLAQISVLHSASGRLAVISPFKGDKLQDPCTSLTLGLLPGHQYVSLIEAQSM